MVVDLRNDLRSLATTEIDKEKKKSMFQVGDKYRDILYNDFSVKVEDKSNLWKFVDKKNEMEEKIEEV